MAEIKTSTRIFSCNSLKSKNEERYNKIRLFQTKCARLPSVDRFSLPDRRRFTRNAVSRKTRLKFFGRSQKMIEWHNEFKDNNTAMRALIINNNQFDFLLSISRIIFCWPFFCLFFTALDSFPFEIYNSTCIFLLMKFINTPFIFFIMFFRHINTNWY